MKICVCASVFGNLHYFNTKQNKVKNQQRLSPKNEKTDMDFYLFTNLTHDVLKSTIHEHWKVITVSDDDDFMKENNFRKDNNVNQVQKSRYFKFQLHKYFNGQYDFIIYLDHHIHLDPNVNWEDIASSVINEATENNLALVQVRHKDGMDSVKREADLIIRCGVDSRININKSLDYLDTINNSVDIGEKIIFRENWIFGYCPKHKETVEHFDIFWGHYLNEKYATRRDQPLWNFLFLARNKRSKMMNLLKFTTNKTNWVNRCNI
jgi:hypothetical protein